MKLLKQALIAALILAGWVALGYWQIKSTSASATETIPIYHLQPPTCKLLTNSYFDYDFSYRPPRLAGWYQRMYIECPVGDGVIILQ